MKLDKLNQEGKKIAKEIEKLNRLIEDPKVSKMMKVAYKAKKELLYNKLVSHR